VIITEGIDSVKGQSLWKQTVIITQAQAVADGGRKRTPTIHIVGVACGRWMRPTRTTRWLREEEQPLSCENPILIERFLIIWAPKIGEGG